MREALQAMDIIFEQADTLESGLEMLLGPPETYTRDDPLAPFVESYPPSLRDPRQAADLAALLVDFRQRFAAWLRAHHWRRRCRC